MRSALLRDDMVQRVQDAYGEAPTFEEQPDGAAGSIRTSVPFQGSEEADHKAYVAALYEVCERGRVTGRNGRYLVGEPIEGL